MMLAAEATTAHLADLMVPFAEAASINVRDATSCLQKRIIVSLQFIHTQALHDALFPNQHFDWQSINKGYLTEVSYSIADWYSIIRLFHFMNEPPIRKPVHELVSSALAGLKVSTHSKALSPIESMQVCFARAGMAPTWDTLCKSLLLCNLADVDHAAALAMLLPPAASASNTSTTTITTITASPASQNITSLIGFLATLRHTPDEYTQAFLHILGVENCQVASHALIKSLKLRDEALERIKQNTQAMMRACTKPSLTRIIEEAAANHPQHNNNNNNNKLQKKQQRSGNGGDSSGHPSSSSHNNSSSSSSSSSSRNFLAFCNACHLPCNTNARIRRACYYIMSLPLTRQQQQQQHTAATAHRAVLSKIVGDDEVVLEAMHSLGSVISPELTAIKIFLSEVQHTGAPPKCLVLFREHCVIMMGAAIHWSTVLRFYLATYSCYCRELWAHALAVAAATSSPYLSQQQYMAAETENAVQAFIKANPNIALEEILPYLLGDMDHDDDEDEDHEDHSASGL